MTTYFHAVGWLPLLAGFVLGVVVAGIVSARRVRRGTMASFRQSPGRAATDPYRGNANSREAPHLDEVVAAVRNAGLDAHLRAGGFDLRRENHVLRLRVADPARVPLPSIDIVNTGHVTLIFELALALLPLYGPILVTEALWGTYIIDGACDPMALRGQRAERIKALARGIQAGLAASQPLWDKLVKRR